MAKVQVNAAVRPEEGGMQTLGGGKRLRLRRRWTRNKAELFLFACLGLLFLAVFAYAPMFGIALAFKRDDGAFDIMYTLTFSDWVLWENFAEFLRDPDFVDVLLNTIGLNVIQLCINFPAPILFAILANELRPGFRSKVQTVSFFPHFLSWVIFGGIFINLLDYDTGILNAVIELFGGEPVDVLGGAEHFWGLIIITSLIKGIGWGSVIYVAAISGISREMYEAAEIDGANRAHRIFYITIPSIKNTIVLFFILSISGILNNGFDHIWVFQNTSNLDRSEVLDTFIYKYGMIERRYAYTTALGLFKSVISLILLIGGNFICKRINGEGIF